MGRIVSHKTQLGVEASFSRVQPRHVHFAADMRDVGQSREALLDAVDAEQESPTDSMTDIRASEKAGTMARNLWSCGALCAMLLLLQLHGAECNLFRNFDALLHGVAAGSPNSRHAVLVEGTSSQLLRLSNAMMSSSCIVQHLTLYRCDLSTAAVQRMTAAIASCSVRNLRLMDSGLETEHVLAVLPLVANDTIVTLDLAGNAISSKAFAALASTLSHNPSLQRLELKFTGMRDGSAVLLAEALKNNTHLEYLGLHRNKLTDIGAAAFAHTLGLPSGEHAVKTKTGLQALHLGNDDKDFDRPYTNELTDVSLVPIFQSLEHNRVLTTFECDKCGATDASIDVLMYLYHMKQSTLVALRLLGNKISDAGAKSVGEELARNPPLEELALGGDLTAAGLQHIGHGLAHNNVLQRLDLSENSIEAGTIVQFGDDIFLNTKLWDLDLSHNPLMCDGVASLMGILHRSEGGMFQSLRKNKGIQHLGLAGVGLDSDCSGVKAIAEALKQQVGLAGLKLSDNGLGDQGVAIIASALRRNTRLRQLQLDGVGVTDDGVVEFMDSIAAVSTGPSREALQAANIPVSMLQSLGWNRNAIGDEAAAGIARLLSQAHTLASVSLDQTGVTDEGGQRLLAAATSNSVIRRISLQETGVSSDIQFDIRIACHSRWEPRSLEEDDGSTSPLKNVIFTVLLFGGAYYMLRRR